MHKRPVTPERRRRTSRYDAALASAGFAPREPSANGYVREGSLRVLTEPLTNGSHAPV